MAKMNFTESQKKAIFFGDKNLLLSAAAGSGKTACLTARIVALITQGRAEISDMLIVTFTKAATSEMRMRIAKTLREESLRLRAEDPSASRRLGRASTMIASAEISTIHSFLYKNLKKYFPIAGYPQDAKILDPSRVDSIKKKIIKKIVDSAFEKPAEEDDRFLELANVIGITRESEKIDREILWIIEKLGGGVNGNQYTDDLRSAADGEDLLATVWGDELKEKIASFAESYGKVFAGFAEELENYPEILEKYSAALDGDMRWIGEVRELCADKRADEIDFNTLKNAFKAYEPARLGTVSKKIKAEICTEYKHFRDRFKKERDEMEEQYFCYDADEIRRSAEKVLRCSGKIHEIAEEFEGELNKTKIRIGGIEYDDLEKIALKLFLDEDGKPSKIAQEIGKKYKYIFVDEYQDTNSAQDRIFASISGHSVRFMVGDIKQSIYRFRGAEPEVFRHYREIWGSAEPDEQRDDLSLGESIFLSENFRCDGPVIDFTNAVSDVTLKYGGIGYLDEDDLMKGKSTAYDEESVEIVLVDKKSDDSSSDAKDAKISDDEENEGTEAMAAAKIVRELIGRYSLPDGRIAAAGDIAIIMRSPGSAAEEYAHELAKVGVRSRVAKSVPLHEYASVRLIVCLLNLVDNPLRDIFTVGALKSPVFGFTADELIGIRRMSDDFIFLTVEDISEMAAENEESEVYDPGFAEKCRYAKEWYDREKVMSRSVGAADYIEYLVNAYDIHKIDEIREDPLEISAIYSFIEKARRFESSFMGGKSDLSSFLEYLKEDEENESDDGIKDENEDAVSILSIHASKGLEYPIVILAGCGKKRNSSDETRTILVDKDCGIGMMLAAENGLERYDNIFRRLIAAKIKKESVAEEMRMLYVALTRAKNKLIVTSALSDAEKKLEKISIENEYTDAYFAGCRQSYIDWILSAAIRHQSEKVGIHVIKADSIHAGDDSVLTPVHSEEDDSPISDDVREAIAQRLAGADYDDFLENVPAKLPVSDLKPGVLDGRTEDLTEDADEKRFTEDGGIYSEDETSDGPLRDRVLPKFMMNEDHASPADRGNAVHLFLQFADFGTLAEDGFEAEIRRMEDRKFLTHGQCELINKKQIERFTGSRLFDKIRRSSFVKREFRFNARVPAWQYSEKQELREKLRAAETKITIQGVVDCVFRDPDSGKLVLVDYKTDSITAEEWKDRSLAEKKLRERHRDQLESYRVICSEMFGEEIETAYVYSTVLGRMISV